MGAGCSEVKQALKARRGPSSGQPQRGLGALERLAGPATQRQEAQVGHRPHLQLRVAEDASRHEGVMQVRLRLAVVVAVVGQPAQPDRELAVQRLKVAFDVVDRIDGIVQPVVGLPVERRHGGSQVARPAGCVALLT